MADNQVKIRVGADLAQIQEAIGVGLPDQFQRAGDAANDAFQGATRGVKSPFLRSVKPVLDLVFADLAALFGVSEVKGVAWRASRGILARNFRLF